MDAQEFGFQAVSHVGSEAAHAIICESPTDVLVAIRGTDDWHDVVKDGRFWPVRSAFGGRVHRGIHEHSLDLWPVIEKVENTAKRLTFTGHSLGGATACHLAQVVGYRRKSKVLPLPHIVEIAAPRIGTPKFCRSVALYTASVTRIVNHRDLVPLLIPGYQHPPGDVLHCNRFGLWTRNPSWANRFKDRARGWGGGVIAAMWGFVLHLFPLENHAIETYASNWKQEQPPCQ